MTNLLIKIREYFARNTVAINGAAMLLFAFVAWFNEQGLIEDWPKTLFSVFGGINLLLAWLGLEPIKLPIPEKNKTIVKKSRRNPRINK